MKRLVSATALLLAATPLLFVALLFVGATSPAAQETPATGAELDLSMFRYRRAVTAGPAGLNSLRLDSAVLAHSSDLADLRLVDEHSKQIPYLLEPLETPLELELPVSGRAADEEGEGRGSRRSVYRVVLPYEGLPASRLVLETSARVFERRVLVRIEAAAVDARPRERLATVDTATWKHADPQRAAPLLEIALPSIAATTLELVIDDGDNEPLPLHSARLLVPAKRLRFVRSGDGPIELVYGAPRLAAPRYDLSLLAPQILGAASADVDVLPERENPVRSDSGVEAGQLDRRVFWAVLAAAVLVLVFVLARLLRLRPGSA